jgi:hypothetical protein
VVSLAGIGNGTGSDPNHVGALFEPQSQSKGKSDGSYYRPA